MKPLDFIKTKKGSIGMIKEVSTTQGRSSASIRFIYRAKDSQEKSAWWSKNEFEIIGSLPVFLAENLCHPFGDNEKNVKKYFE